MKLRSHKSLVLPATLVLIALICAAPLWAAPPTPSQKVQGIESVGFAPGLWFAALWDSLRVAWGAAEGGAKIDIDGLTLGLPEEGGTQAQATDSSELPESLDNTTEEGPRIDIDG